MSHAGDTLKACLDGISPRVAIVLGSSLAGVAEAVAVRTSIPFADLEGFPRPSISGHAGTLLLGCMGKREVVVLKGRAHPYESGNPAVMRPAIEALAHIGIQTLLLTNAAGSLMPGVGPGSLMLVTDHVNFSGMNPLIGEPGDIGLVSMTHAYDRKLNDGLRAAARAAGIALAEGVYMWFSGPSFETPAEIRAARILGADAVGMSTVPEVLIARRHGLRVAAVSLVTNFAAGIEDASPSHAETKEQGALHAGGMRRLLEKFLEDYSDA